MKDMTARGKEDAEKDGKNKDDEFAREFTCKFVVLPFCRLDVRFLLVSCFFVVYLHVNLRANSSSFFLAVLMFAFLSSWCRCLHCISAREFTCKLVVLHSRRFSSGKNGGNKNDGFARKFTCRQAMKDMTARGKEGAEKGKKNEGRRVCT